MRRRWTTDVVGRRIFKANSITFGCRTAFVGLASSSSTSACSCPTPLPHLLSHPFVWFLQFFTCSLCFFFCASLFFWFCFFFSFSFYSEFANELRLKTKITCKARKVPKTKEEQRSRRGTGVRCLRKCISFLIFFRRKIEMRFIYYVFHFEQRRTSLTHSLVRSSHRYLHSSFSIHSASHEKVSTSYKLHMYLGLYVSVCARIYVHKQFSEQFGIRMAI